MHTKKCVDSSFSFRCNFGLHCSNAHCPEKIFSNQNVYQVGYHTDYAYTLVPDLYDTADVVVFGTYLGNSQSSAIDNSLIQSSASFQVQDVFKGDISDNIITFSYVGGTVPLGEYMSFMSQEQISKYGFDDPVFQRENPYISLSGDELPQFSDGKTYVLFLTHDMQTGELVVLADAYGARETNSNGGLYDPATKTFIYS